MMGNEIFEAKNRTKNNNNNMLGDLCADWCLGRDPRRVDYGSLCRKVRSPSWEMKLGCCRTTSSATSFAGGSCSLYPRYGDLGCFALAALVTPLRASSSTQCLLIHGCFSNSLSDQRPTSKQVSN